MYTYLAVLGHDSEHIEFTGPLLRLWLNLILRDQVIIPSSVSRVQESFYYIKGTRPIRTTRTIVLCIIPITHNILNSSER